MNLEEHVSVGALALGLPANEVLYVTFEEHILFRASTLEYPNSTFCVGDGPRTPS